MQKKSSLTDECTAKKERLRVFVESASLRSNENLRRPGDIGACWLPSCMGVKLSLHHSPVLKASVGGHLLDCHMSGGRSDAAHFQHCYSINKVQAMVVC